jgi:ribonuclease HII
MTAIDKDYPVYEWFKNKGYPTKKHREAIIKFGDTEHHRKSFQLIPSQLKMKL